MNIDGSLINSQFFMIEPVFRSFAACLILLLLLILLITLNLTHTLNRFPAFNPSSFSREPADSTKCLSMAIDGFKRLYHDADQRTDPGAVAVAGGDDPTVLEAMRIACDSGWVRPILVGPEPRIRAIAESHARSTSTASRSATPRATRSPRRPWPWSRAGEAQALMKGQIATPALMKAVLDHDTGLRTGRVVCQVVLMEIPRDRRRFLLADTGISVQPSLDERIDILRSTVEVAEALWETTPKVAPHGGDRDRQAVDARDRRGRRARAAQPAGRVRPTA